MGKKSWEIGARSNPVRRVSPPRPLKDAIGALIFGGRRQNLQQGPGSGYPIANASEPRFPLARNDNFVGSESAQRAFLMGCTRKYVALFNHEGGGPITSLHYFAAIVEEVAAMEKPLNYWRYLESRVRKMDCHWRAQAKFAPATPSAGSETK